MRKTDLPDGLNVLACAGLDRNRIRELAFETGFCHRASGKIHASDFLVHLCLQSVEGTVSYNDLAARIHTQTGHSASRQAYWERTDEPCVRFFHRVLECIMLSQCPPDEVAALRTTGRFARILLQDSTVIQLPLRLFEVFSGVRNAHTSVCNARIQGIYDLLAGRFIRFSIDPYSKNDQAATLDIPVEPGDLVLRDRGYFSLEAISTHHQAGADCITRYKHYTALLNPATGQPLNLLDVLTRNGSVDMEVWAGSKEKVRLRLVAVRVDEETANLRRMKAKKEMKGRAPSQELLRLMSWSIFLTTLTDPAITLREILALYGMRWRIENIFKTWKGNFSFAKLHNVSEVQLRVLLSARLIMITLAYERLFLPLMRHVLQTTGKQLSLMKFMRYLSRNLPILHRLSNHARLAPRLRQALHRYCTYEKRRRPNFTMEMQMLLLNTVGAGQ